jgi:hypothetical protein
LNIPEGTRICIPRGFGKKIFSFRKFGLAEFSAGDRWAARLPWTDGSLLPL